MIYDLEVIFTNVKKISSFVDEDRSMVICEIDENSIISYSGVNVLLKSLYTKLLDYEVKGLLSSNSKVSFRKNKKKKHIDGALPFGYIYVQDQNEHNIFFEFDSIFTDFNVIKNLASMEWGLSYNEIVLREKSDIINSFKYIRNDLLVRLDGVNSNAIFRKFINRLVMNYYRPVQSKKNRYINYDVEPSFKINFGGGFIEVSGHNLQYLTSLVRIVKSEDFSR